MPKVYPFKALRPMPEYASKVSAKSSDFSNQNLLAEEIRTNPFTFHHVTKNHLNYSGAFQEPEKFLPFAARFIQEMKETQILIKEEEECFYLYHQINTAGRHIKGVIGLCSVDDYREDVIKKHEAIRPSRLNFLVELFKTTKVMGEPTLLAHPEPIEFDESKSTVVSSFTSVDGKHHEIRKISDKLECSKIQEQYKKMNAFYIADGHHRSASIEEFNNQYPTLHNDKSLCLILQEDELGIKPFHRLIKPVLPVNYDDLLNLLSKKFVVSPINEALYDPEIKHDFGLYMNKQWYKVVSREKSDKMDMEILEDDVVREIFEISDSRTDSQISFHPYGDGLTSLINLVDSGTFDIAFTSKACTFQEVRKVSDMHHTLPAKSTYIEPKLRAGMIIQEFY
jgi:uncharacterized protein (DUF1015 family)